MKDLKRSDWSIRQLKHGATRDDLIENDLSTQGDKTVLMYVGRDGFIHREWYQR